MLNPCTLLSKLKIGYLWIFLLIQIPPLSSQRYFSVELSPFTSLSALTLPEDITINEVSLLSGKDSITTLQEELLGANRLSFGFSLGLKYRLNRFGGVSFQTGFLRARLNSALQIRNETEFAADEALRLDGWYNLVGAYAEFKLHKKIEIMTQFSPGLFTYRIPPKSVLGAIEVDQEVLPFATSRQLNQEVPAVGLHAKLSIPLFPSSQLYFGYTGFYTLQNTSYQRAIILDLGLDPVGVENFTSPLRTSHHLVEAGVKWDIGVSKKVKSFVHRESKRKVDASTQTLKVKIKNKFNKNKLTLELQQDSINNVLQLEGGWHSPALSGLADSLKVSFYLPSAVWNSLIIPTEKIKSGKSLAVNLLDLSSFTTIQTTEFDKFFYRIKKKKNAHKYWGRFKNVHGDQVRFTAETHPIPLLAVLAVVITGGGATYMATRDNKTSKRKRKHEKTRPSIQNLKNNQQDSNIRTCRWWDLRANITPFVGLSKDLDLDIRLSCDN